MVGRDIIDQIKKSQVLQQVISETDLKSQILIKGLAGSLKSIFLAILFEHKKRPILYVTADEDQEEMVREDLELILGSYFIVHFPQLHGLAFARGFVELNRKGQFLSAIEQLIQQPNRIAITSAKNLVFKLPAVDQMIQRKVILSTGEKCDFERLKVQLIELGFNRESVVENPGEMSVRGGLIDLFPISSEYPYRVEFFGDTIESIRIFNPATQRSIQSVSEIRIYPQDFENGADPSASFSAMLFEYFPPGSIIFWDEPEVIKKDIDSINLYASKNNVANNRNKDDIIDVFKYDEIANKLRLFTIIDCNSLLSDTTPDLYRFHCYPQEVLRGNLQILRQKIHAYCQKGTIENSSISKIYFLCDHDSQVERLDEIFESAEIKCDRLMIRNFGLNQGFIFDEVGLVVFTDNQFYGRPVRGRRRKKFSRGLTLNQLLSLSVGDFVVHVDHGIGQYQGLKKITVQGHERECLSIGYRDGDILYVPLDRMDRVQKYSAKEGVVPTLSKLGSKDWERLKHKTKKHIKDIARELIAIYAQRKAQKGFAFSKDTLWQKELEASFEYEDTPDQKRATEEIKRDMESEYPMDRLVCGDVGYGKTEVAVRAAFKAVNDNKQVAILVPTTVLALQHYNLFKERLARYPITIEMLSRFRSRSEQQRIVELLKAGKIDIVIGTHRLLSNDIKFKDLGLLIIDEEHRFGVSHKERLKKLQLNVDVISMSATPIPRTLNMAMLGIRDMSLIATPPKDRLPIHTEIIPFDKKLIRAAILREIERGGQVFFVHNRVQTIEGIANYLRRLMPEVSFGVAHGQMDERDLEKVMWDFATQKFHCLVSTMIIESGLDIPNVNTMIINRADRFGLSQLYQLRGRVGRSNQRAYAYLVVPPIQMINRNAIKRLQIIEELTELGAGFNIAMRDLEIRGAGNIFGAEQSGHIIALGYEMYVKIIEQAIQELKLEQQGLSTQPSQPREETKVEIDQDAFLPDDFIDPAELKVDIYRRLANCSDLESVEQIEQEVIDRFGRLPAPAKNLFNFVALKIIGTILDFRLIKISDHTLKAYFAREFGGSSPRELIENKVCSIMQKAEGNFYFVQEGKGGLGLHIDIPRDELDPIAYGKDFLKRLI
ncbi:MAG: transcription-repair coupling factor [candidate division KSB1 bacterium]|nr:transcription-repair coupling factor [candidate division KSB1 bacterium]MDZ7399816.1 transcription-repair coupling factor [candidate division KSB1 bacterium]